MSEFNLNNFLGAPNISGNGYINESIFKKAALKHDFNINTDFNEFDKEDIDLLKDRSILKMNGSSQLNDLDQEEILEELIDNNKLQDLISDFHLDNSVFSNLLFKVLNKEKISLESLSNEQIYYYGRVLKLIPGQEIKQLYLKNFLERKQFLSKFKKPIKDFAGRKKELTILKNYVDWLPISGFFPKIEKIFRDVTDWHQKKLLLIKGIGGIGKTALISKFIDQHSITKNKQNLPFVYFDFDMVGFSIKEPLNFLIEGLKQLELQFVSKREELKYIRLEISNTLNKDNNRGYNTRRSNLSSRENLFDRLKKQHSKSVEKIKTPVLIVFDSFEEMQYKASHYDLIEFFEFIEIISELIPRIRPIFIGRAEIDESLKQFDFFDLTIKEFDKESANVILENNGVNDKKARNLIFNQLGGNPLVLNLAASLYKKSPNFIYSKDLHKSDEIQEYLVGRILDHIHDEKAKSIAIPGLLVRKINPKVIKEVLAVPCELVDDSKKLSLTEAENIFEIIKKESFLMQSSNKKDEFVFRQDLRMACEKMILAKDAAKSIEIHKAAIKFYKNKPSDKAEYKYHVLKLKEHSDFIEDNLDTNIDFESAEMLQESFKELSEESQLNIKNVYGSKASLDMLESSGSRDVSEYYVRQIEEVLLTGYRQMGDLHEEISQTSLLESYCKSKEFLFMYATLKQRLGLIEESIYLIQPEAVTPDDYRTGTASDILEHAKFIFLFAENLFYLKKYSEVNEHLLKLDVRLYQGERILIGFEEAFVNYEDFMSRYLTMRLKTLFLLNIAKSKINIETPKNIRTIFLEVADQYLTQSNFEKFLKIIALDQRKLNTKWVYIITEIYKNEESINYLSSAKFENSIRSLRNSIKSYKELEYISKNELNVYLKDITLEGHLEILIFDFVIAKEISNLNRDRHLIV